MTAATDADAAIRVAGPWFEDFRVGDSADGIGVTLTDGLAALHQAAFGDRLALALDHELSRRVCGIGRPFANPMLVTNVAIGQTTWASQRVIGNLYYRSLGFLRPVFLGDTLRAHTRVVALRQNRSKPGRAASGMVVLEMTVRNQEDAEVMHFWRCPMIACRDAQAVTGHEDDLQGVPDGLPPGLSDGVPGTWDVAPFAQIGGRGREHLSVGQRYEIEAVDTVTFAPEVVRATLNLAMVHTDAAAGVHGRRLVYGGHTISMAAVQLSRALPRLLTIAGWDGCDHLGPVFEGDRLQTDFEVVSLQPAADVVRARLRVRVRALRDGQAVPVLDWSLLALVA